MLNDASKCKHGFNIGECFTCTPTLYGHAFATDVEDEARAKTEEIGKELNEMTTIKSLGLNGKIIEEIKDVETIIIIKRDDSSTDKIELLTTALVDEINKLRK